MGQPVVHFEIHTGDIGGLRSFYSELFGWKLGLTPDQSYALIDTDSGDQGIRGGIAAFSEIVRGVIVYVAVDDIDRALRLGESAGGRTLIPRTDSGRVITAILADPDGNAVGLVERPPSADAAEP